ncbi:gas vesicle protein GvpN [Desulfofundulus sp. TPOSR]|uniref:gas vesicle protein GvpN n=1 Tax=Desulfofundulus sp. TPOSR TaxID=2714340 RepID=UPI001FAB9263|nr:gas vesicle protein GvpN [Desulfofundulus sp. TPOSR]
MIDKIYAQVMENFVQTAYIKDLTARALAYIRAGLPVHLRGPAGTGKTTLALHLASQIGRPVVLLHGNDDFTSTDLIGDLHGYKISRVIDNFIHSVLKTEEQMSLRWQDACITEACRNGYTLIYDEFTRSRPEANNILLSILEERILELPPARKGERYLQIHPDFRAIFTSNPAEYAGVYKSQDALRDRMITLDLDYFDEETEIAITAAKSGLPVEEAERVVRIVRSFREKGEYEFTPTVRASIAIARVISLQDKRDISNPFLRQIYLDVLTSESGSTVSTGKTKGKARNNTATLIQELLNQYYS